MKKSQILLSTAAVLASLVLTGTPVTANAAGALGGVISEVKVGILDHDAARDSRGKMTESDTVDFNGELLSVPLVFGKSATPFVQSVLQPRIHLGFTANTAGYTNTFYSGLTWDFNLTQNIFFDFAFGLAGNDGKLNGIRTDGRPNLGSPITFREAIELGYRLTPQHSLSIVGSHISHASMFAPENDGMNFIGGRYGYKFD
ncbi:MAG: acyloxyacyl hydrolase [Rhodospirillaceae bacterium]